jgi:hypothetical protein
VEDLRRAQGKVRCGDCEHVFNAVAYLTENNESEFTEDGLLAESANDSYAGETPIFSLDTTPANEEIDGSDDDDSDDDSDDNLAQGVGPDDNGFDDDEEDEDEDDGHGILITDAGDDVDEKTYVRVAVSKEAELDADAEADDSTDTATQPHLDIDATEETDDREELILADSDDGEPHYYTDNELDTRRQQENEQDDSDTDDSEETEPRYYSDDSGIDDEEPDTPETDKKEPRYYSDDAGIDDEEWLVEETIDEQSDKENPEASEDDDDFDDTIWERIPGVGTSTDGANNSDDIGPADEESGNPDSGPFMSAVDPEDGLTEEASDGPSVHLGGEGGITGADDLEFNVPEERWSNFFGKIPDDAQTPDWSALASGGSEEDGASEDIAGREANDRSETGEKDDEDEWSNIDSGEWSEAESDDDDATEDAVSSGDANDQAAPAYEYGSDQDIEDYATTPPWQPEVHAAEEQEQPPSRSGRWFLLGLVLLVGFTAQLIHYNRDALAAHPSFGKNIRNIYARLGGETFPAWPISNYEIRGSEAVAGESGPDVLDIRTQIASVGDQPTGLPQLRVVLRDRWSNPVAARHFSPEEYLLDDELPASGMLLPNETINALVSIVDPGSGAQGFELQLCLPRRGTGLDCTGQPFE